MCHFWMNYSLKKCTIQKVTLPQKDVWLHSWLYSEGFHTSRLSHRMCFWITRELQHMILASLCRQQLCLLLVSCKQKVVCNIRISNFNMSLQQIIIIEGPNHVVQTKCFHCVHPDLTNILLLVGSSMSTSTTQSYRWKREMSNISFSCFLSELTI